MNPQDLAAASPSIAKAAQLYGKQTGKPCTEGEYLCAGPSHLLKARFSSLLFCFGYAPAFEKTADYLGPTFSELTGAATHLAMKLPVPIDYWRPAPRPLSKYFPDG
jgi:hypothetical protein